MTTCQLLQDDENEVKFAVQFGDAERLVLTALSVTQKEAVREKKGNPPYQRNWRVARVVFSTPLGWDVVEGWIISIFAARQH